MPQHALQRQMILARSGKTAAVFAVTLGVTVGIILWMMRLRSSVFDPESAAIFQLLFIFYDYPAALMTLVLLVAGIATPVQHLGSWAARALAAHPLVTATVAAVLLAAGAVFVYHGHPLAMDEYAPVFQSKVFAAGRLAGQFPPELVDWLVPRGFQQYFLHVSHESGAVASSYWPGFALLLTPFTFVGAPWLCNPILGVASILVVHRLGREMLGSREASGMVVLFLLASVAFTINAISYYSMTAHLLCNAVFVLLLLRPAPLKCLAAGLVGGLALSLHNPVPHALFAAPWIFWLAFQPGRWRLLGALILGYAPLVLVLGVGWAAHIGGIAGSETGIQEMTPVGVYQEISRRLNDLLHLPSADVLFARGIGLAKVWLWTAPALVVLAGLGLWKRRRESAFMLLAASCILTLLGYLFVPFDQGHGWGFRYFHPAWFAIPLLAAAAFDWRSDAPLNSDLCRYAAGAAALSLVAMTGLRAFQVEQFMSRHLAQLPVWDDGSAKILIVNPAAGYYASDLVQNDPFLRNDPLIMITNGRAKDAEMIRNVFTDLSLLDSSYRGTVWGDLPEKTRLNSEHIGSQTEK